MKKLDIETWIRKEHFYYFLEFDQPFFNIVAEIDVSDLKKFSQERDLSFFLCSFYILLICANRLEPFRYRLRGKEVIIHDKIDGGCPIMKNDRTFTFTHLPYIEDFKEFYEFSSAKVEKIKVDAPFRLDPKDDDNLFHSSVIPWTNFIQFEHAKKFDKGDSTPKFVIGKYAMKEGKLMMPLSIAVHHALMDGIDVSDFFELYQSIASKPEQHLS